MQHIARKYPATLLLLLLAVSLAHCGRGNAAREQNTEPVELHWVTLDVNSQVEETLAANFRQQQPHITFQRESLNFGQDYLAIQPAPDILMTFANQAYFEAGSANQLANLDEVWQAAGLNDNTLTGVQTLLTNRDNGGRHMLPIAFSWAGIYYNQEIFAQYNLQPPQTWDEFLQICAILQANGETPLAMAGTEGYATSLWFDYLNLRINGVEFHRALVAGEERFDDPRVGLVLESWRTLFQQGFVVARPEFMDERAAVHALVRGDQGLLSGEEAVMVLIDTFSLNAIDPAYRAELNFFPFPSIDPAVPQAEAIDVIGYVIPTGATHGPQSQLFLTYLASAEAQTLIAREASVINVVFAPVRTDVEADALRPEMSKAIAVVQDAADVVPFTLQSMPPALWQAFSRAYRQLLTDKQDIATFMDSMENARQTARESGTLE